MSILIIVEHRLHVCIRDTMNIPLYTDCRFWRDPDTHVRHLRQQTASCKIYLQTICGTLCKLRSRSIECKYSERTLNFVLKVLRALCRNEILLSTFSCRYHYNINQFVGRALTC